MSLNLFSAACDLLIPLTFLDDGAGVVAAYALTLANIACNWGAAAGPAAAEAA